MDNLIFNLRIWKIHFQIENILKISFIFRWYDLWIGLYIDKETNTYYLFLLPTIGIKIQGINICKNRGYSFKNDPFIWLFRVGKKYFPMRDYDTLNVFLKKKV